MTRPSSSWRLPTFTVVLSFLGDTCLAYSQPPQCAGAVGLRRDALMAVITLWIVTADQGHNKTIVAAILEKVLNRGDMLSEGYPRSLETHYQLQRDSQANQAMAGSDTEERTEPAQRLPSTLIGGGRVYSF